MKKCLITAVLLLGWAFSNGQVRFAIHGKIGFPANGKIYLTTLDLSSEYYAQNTPLDSADVNNGSFVLNIIHPDSGIYAYRLTMPAYGRTGMALIGPDDRNIEIKSFDEYFAPVIKGSRAQYEISNEYEVLFKDIINRAGRLDAYSDSLYDAYGKYIPESSLEDFRNRQMQIVTDADSIFYSYALRHSNSSVSLWKLIERFQTFGYKEIYWNSFLHLSPSLRKSISGNVLKRNLLSASLIAKGRKFPSLSLQDIQGNHVKLEIKDCHVKLYLVDFWFTNCPPCLRDMVVYHQLYDRYKNAGFEIIGISTDGTRDKTKWKEKISQDKIAWKNYLDENGLLAKVLNISKYPTTFLLDSEGYILVMDISIYQLKKKLVEMNNNIDLYEKQPIDVTEPS